MLTRRHRWSGFEVLAMLEICPSKPIERKETVNRRMYKKSILLPMSWIFPHQVPQSRRSLMQSRARRQTRIKLGPLLVTVNSIQTRSIAISGYVGKNKFLIIQSKWTQGRLCEELVNLWLFRYPHLSECAFQDLSGHFNSQGLLSTTALRKEDTWLVWLNMNLTAVPFLTYWLPLAGLHRMRYSQRSMNSPIPASMR